MSKSVHSPSDRADQILTLLEQAEDWRSGEEISVLLGITRAAVAKHVSALRAKGNVIESLTRRGYRLLVKHEPLEAAAVRTNLKTHTMGRTGWHIFPQITSTNNEAVRLAMEGAPEGTIVFAECQSKGHGKKGKAWFSAPRGLQFSVILRPEIPETSLEWLHALGVLAIVEALEGICPIPPQAKKPNDVLLHGKKIAGVLAVTGFRAGEADWAVLGIGCNVNALTEDFPPELAGLVTSPLAAGTPPLSRALLLAAILNRLEEWYTMLCQGDTCTLADTWEKRTA